MTIKESFDKKGAEYWYISADGVNLGKYSANSFYEKFHDSHFWTQEPERVVMNYTNNGASALFVF